MTTTRHTANRKSGNMPVAEKPKLKIIGTDGNAFALLGKAQKVALAHKLDWPVIYKEATAGDYNHLLATLTKYFDVD